MTAQTIVDLLQSKKLKDRNEGLRTIETCLPGLFSSDIKEVIAVSKALLGLIHYEYLNREKTSTASVRITTASYLLRSTLEQSVMKLPPRPSGYLSILNSLMSQINDIVFPDFMKSIKVIIEQQYIKDHLNSQMWDICIQFCISYITKSVGDMSSFSESIEILNTLINSNSICYLAVNKINLKSLLEAFFEMFYKSNESNVLIYTNILRILNKILMQSSSEKFESLDGYVKLGIKVVNYVKFKYQNRYSINDEISIFLNLDYVHRCLIESSKKDSSIIDDIRSLVTYQLNEIHSTNILLHYENIGLSLNDDPKHWFKLQTVYLKNQDYSMWLFLMGLTKLIISYFRCSQIDGTTKTNETDNSFRNYKRRKHEGILHVLMTSANEIEFVSSLLSFDKAETFKLVALQLLMFVLEFEDLATDLQLVSKSTKSGTPSGTGSDDKEDLTESEFDWNLSILANNSVSSHKLKFGTVESSPDDHNLIRLLLVASNFKVLNFWSLLLLNSLVFRIARSDIAISTKQINEIIKLVLPYVKTEQNGDISCHLLYNLVQMTVKKGIDLSKISDKSLFNQVQSVLELASYSGPIFLTNSSFRFWVSLFKLMKLLGLNVHEFQTSLADWMLSKWDQVFDVTSESFCKNFPMFTAYVYWMLENEIKNVYVPDFDSYNGQFKALYYVQSMSSSFRQRFKREVPKSVDIDFRDNFNMDFSFNKIVEKFFNLKNQIKLKSLDYIVKFYYYKIMALDLELFKDECKTATHGSNKKLYSYQVYEIMTHIYQLRRPELFTKLFDTAQIFLPFEGTKGNSDTDFQTNSNRNYDMVSTFDDIIYCSGNIRDTNVHFREIDVIVFVLSNIKELNRTSAYFTTWLNSLEPRELVYMLAQLSCCDDLEVSETNALGEALKTFGKTVLQNLALERNELVFIILFRLTAKLASHQYSSSMVSDFLNWIVTAANKSLFLTKNLCSEYLRMVLQIRGNVNIDEKRYGLAKSFFNYFSLIDIDLRVGLVEDINKYLEELKSASSQVLFYKELVDCFRVPSTDSEAIAYCLFLASLSLNNFDITKSVIFNLFEIAWLQKCYIPMVRDSLDLISKNLNMPDRKRLFRSIKVSIFKAWYSHHSLVSFPYKAMGDSYETQKEFYEDNAIEMLSVILSSIKSNDRKEEFHRILEGNPNIKMLDIIPLAYSLAFLHDGVRNEISIILQDITKIDCSDPLKLNINVTVLSIMKYLDTSRLHDLENYVEAPDFEFSVMNSLSLDLISFKTGMQLIKKLLPNSSDWCKSRTHFLITQLLVDLKYQFTQKQEILSIRRIILILLIYDGQLEFGLLSSIIRNTLILASIDSALSDEVSNLFTVLNFGEYSYSLEKGKFDELILQILSTIVQPRAQNSRVLLADLENFTSIIEIFQNLPSAYTKHFSYLQKLCISREVTSLQPFAVDPFIEIKVKGSFADGLNVCSFFGEYGILTRTENLKFIDAISSCSLESYSGEFKYLCAKTIAKGFVKSNLKERNPSRKDFEFANLQPGNYLERLVTLLIKFQDDNDIELAGLADLTLGVLSNVDLHLFEAICELKTANVDIPRFDRENIGSIFKPLQYVPTTITSGAFSSWLTEKFFLIVNDLNPLRHKAVHAIKEFGNFSFNYIIKAFPYVMCYLIDHCSKKGMTTVYRILNWFFNDETLQDLTLCETMLRSILLIRLENKLKKPNFANLYQSLDVERICMVAGKFNYSSTALMLFEDYYFRSKYDMERFDSISNWYQKDYLIHVFESIDCDDLIDGLPKETNLESTLKSMESNSEIYFNDRSKFELGLFESGMMLNSLKNCYPLIEGLLNDGLSATGKLIGEQNNITGDVNFEWAWKLNNWNLPAPEKPQRQHEFVYKALKLVRNERPLYAQAVLSYESETSAVDLKLKHLLIDLMDQKDHLFNANTPNSKRDTFHSTLLMLHNIHDLYKRGDIGSEGLSSLSELPFEKVDNIIFSRVMALSVLDLEKDTKKSAVLQGLAMYNNISIESGRDQSSVKSISLIHDLSKTEENDNKLTTFSMYHIAKGIWHLGHHKSALSMMLQVKERVSHITEYGYYNHDFSDINLFMVDSLLAGWLSASRQELPTNIMDNYFHEVTSLKNNCSPHLIGKTYAKLGKFCEDQYRNGTINTQLTKLNIQIITKKKELEQLKEHYSRQAVPSQEKKLVQKYYTSLKQQVASETTDQQSLVETRNSFILKCIECYLTSVFNISDFEIVDNFFSLWFEESNLEILNHFVETRFSEQIMDHPSLFVGWISQLVSRLSDEPDTDVFQNLVQKLITSICIKYPYHSLYHLLSLKEHMNQMGSSFDNEMMFSKIRAANRVFEAVKSSRTSSYPLEPIVSQMTQFCNESISLSKFQLPKSKKLDLRTTTKLNAKFWNSLPRMPCPTQNMEITDIETIRSLPTLESINPIITVASSGLSLPKICKFRLTNGEETKVLFKSGVDDLRQDAVMEQVFDKVNQILNKNKRSERRNLRIRTYKIIPLGPNSGVLEFVANSMALIDIIKPYHDELDKVDHSKAREIMRSCQNDSRQERIRVFKNQVMAKVNPVLHHFFFDNYFCPQDWFQNRVTYSRGLAITSMIGHILGLGDRHCNNILLDKNTAEPIHIDLGVAFDQGTKLQIPETVPFRLTRDLVDGLGVTGVNGIFRGSCEVSFKILRENRDHIVSILNVFKWDPLYKWTISPLRRKKLQLADDHNALYNNEEHDISEGGRAILMVKDKLQANGLSSEAIVQELITCATDVENLALIFSGWSPFY